MKSFKQFIIEKQEHTSSGTSLNQISAGLKYAIKNNIIKPNSLNIDNGGGKYNLGKDYVENNVENAKLHIHDPFNRSEDHNDSVKHLGVGNADYTGMHNVLNVIKSPEDRKSALETVRSFMKPKTGIAHISVYEGNKSGEGKISKADNGNGSCWQNHQPTSAYIPEIKQVFPDSTHDISTKSGHIIIKQK